jgi:fatty acid synthase
MKLWLTRVRKTEEFLINVSKLVYIMIGVSPYTERGNRTGVFYAVSKSEAGIMWDTQPNLVEGQNLTGTTLSMFANRISYTWDLKGPSCSYDTACSSSIVALNAAVCAMRRGECDSALVVGSTLILSPVSTLEFQKLGMLAKDSRCKTFDARGDGYVRAETVAAIYLQKAENAKRIYTSVVAVKTNTDGYKERGVTYPSAQIQEKLLHEIYNEAEVDPREVSYVEAHGTGTPAGDPQEILSLSRVFGKERTTDHPLLIGSVKSNMGHSEGASGLCAIAKIITMLRHGVIPANLHFKIPNHELNYIRNGFIKVDLQ